MQTRMNRALGIAAAVVGLMVSGCTTQGAAGRIVHESASPLSFGTFPFRQGQALVTALDPLSDYLEAQLHRRVRFRLVGSYAELEELVNAGHVDFGWFSPRGAGAAPSPMETLVRPKSGTRYRGLIVARKDSGATTLAGLAGKSFAYVDRSSNSGFVYPNRVLRAQGIDPLKAFAEVHFAGNHDRVVEGVLTGLYEAGAASEIAVQDPERAARVAAELTVLARTDEMTPDPLVVRADLEPALKVALRTALLNAKATPQGAQVLAQLSTTLGIEGFEAPGADDQKPTGDR